MSKLQKEISALVELKAKRGESDDDFRVRLAAAASELDDDVWAELSESAQDWVNDALDALNAKKKVVPPFPDAAPEEEPEPEAKSARRGRAAAKEETAAPAPAPYKPKVGDVVAIVTKRGKNKTGEILEIDGDILILEIDGEEEEVALSAVGNIGLAGDGKKEAAPPPAPKEPGVGDQVKAVTKRGKEVTGKIVDIDDETVVLDTEEGEQEFARDRLTSLELVAPKAGRGAAKAEPKEEESKPARGRGAKASADAPTESKRAGKGTNAGVSVGVRVRELVIDDMEATQEEITKILKSEGLTFQDATVSINFTDAHKMLDLLKKAGKLK